MELAEELAGKQCELKLPWVERDANQFADDFTNVKLYMFYASFRTPLKGMDLKWWQILDKLLAGAGTCYDELKSRKEAKWDEVL